MAQPGDTVPIPMEKLHALIARLQEYHAELQQKIEMKEEELQHLLQHRLREHSLSFPARAAAPADTAPEYNPDLRVVNAAAETLHASDTSCETATKHVDMSVLSTTPGEPGCAYDALAALPVVDSIVLPLTGEQRRFSPSADSMVAALQAHRRTPARRSGREGKLSRDSEVPQDSIALSPIQPVRASNDHRVFQSARTTLSVDVQEAPMVQSQQPLAAFKGQDVLPVTEQRHVRFSSRSPQVAVFSVERSETVEEVAGLLPLRPVPPSLPSPRQTVKGVLQCIQRVRRSLEDSMTSSSISSGQEEMDGNPCRNATVFQRIPHSIVEDVTAKGETPLHQRRPRELIARPPLGGRDDCRDREARDAAATAEFRSIDPWTDDEEAEDAATPQRRAKTATDAAPRPEALSSKAVPSVISVPLGADAESSMASPSLVYLHRRGRTRWGCADAAACAGRTAPAGVESTANASLVARPSALVHVSGMSGTTEEPSTLSSADRSVRVHLVTRPPRGKRGRDDRQPSPPLISSKGAYEFDRETVLPQRRGHKAARSPRTSSGQPAKRVQVNSPSAALLSTKRLRPEDVMTTQASGFAAGIVLACGPTLFFE